jgi:hypothetical protein
LSSGKRTKHLDIRYFYVKALIDRGIINVSHCVTNEMIADFLTKPLQGNRFKRLRDIILNIPLNHEVEHRSMLVNKNNNCSTSKVQELVNNSDYTEQFDVGKQKYRGCPTG